jgi:hypothetical protein
MHNILFKTEKEWDLVQLQAKTKLKKLGTGSM